MAKQDEVFGDIGARGQGPGDNSGSGRGTNFDGAPGAGAAIDVSGDCFEFGRHDSLGAANIDACRVGHEGAVGTAKVASGRQHPAGERAVRQQCRRHV